MFEIEGKVALVTGGASGIGLQYAKELLRNGLRGCTLADINEIFGKQAVQEITEEFDKDRVIFVKTDVSDRSQFEGAFKATIEKFKHIDILINNAGIMNDFIWEKEILINLNGTIHGCLLGLEEYFPKYKSGNEAVIVNVSSTAGLDEFGNVPIYTATKHAIVGLSRSLAIALNYKRTQVKVLTICPGQTNTPLINYDKSEQRCLAPVYEEFFKCESSVLRHQPTTFVAKCLVRIIREAQNGTVWLVEYEGSPIEIIFKKRNEREKGKVLKI